MGTQGGTLSSGAQPSSRRCPIEARWLAVLSALFFAVTTAEPQLFLTAPTTFQTLLKPAVEHSTQFVEVFTCIIIKICFEM